MKISLLIVTLMVMIGLSSCSKDETIITPPTNDTLSYSFSNLNDSIITINYAVGGSTSSQMVSWAAPSVNLMKNPLNIRFNSMHLTNGSLMVQLQYETLSDTIKRQAFTMSIVRDSLRVNLTGPANRLNLTPTNFKGRGTITVYK